MGDAVIASRSLALLGACLALAACSTPRYASPNNPPPSSASNTAWYTTSVPPQGYVMTDQDPLVGRTVEDRDNDYVGVVSYVLYHPSGDTTRYVAVSDRSYYGYLLIPVSGLRITNNAAWVDQRRAELLAYRHYSLAELEEHYPPTNMRQTVLAVPAVAPSTGLPPVAVTPATAPLGSGPMMLAWRGGATGAPVYDSTGTYVGTLAGNAVDPATGAVRYAIVSGPSLGAGYYIAVPATSASYINGRVVLNAPLATWQAMPHYQMAQLQQAYGTAGVMQ